MANNQAFDEGRQAFQYGKKLPDCLYSKGTFRRQWQNGWQLEKDKSNG